jgi:hypothetical protein
MRCEEDASYTLGTSTLPCSTPHTHILQVEAISPPSLRSCFLRARNKISTKPIQ